MGEHENDPHKVVAVEHQDATVNVLFWDGTRELHSEDPYTRVLLNEPTRAALDRMEG